MEKLRYMMVLGCCLMFCAGCAADKEEDYAAQIEGTGTRTEQEGRAELENMGFDGPGTDGSYDTSMEEEIGPVWAKGETAAERPRADVGEMVDDASVQNDLNRFSALDGIGYAGGGKILLFADKIYLYDLTVRKVAAETGYPDGDASYGDFTTWMTDNGYVLAYQTFSRDQEPRMYETIVSNGTEGSRHTMFAYYDADLCLQKTVDVTGLGAEVLFTNRAAPSKDGGRIAVCEIGKGISIYDLETLEKTEVLRTDKKDYAATTGSLEVSRIAFAEDDNKIVFLGNCNENGEGYKCIGSVNTDGSGLTVHKSNIFDVMSAYGHHAIFSEELPDDRAGGQVWVYYPSEDKTEVVQTSEKMESSYAWGSDKGNYFITAIEDEDTGWILRLYDVQTLKPVSTKIFELENTEDYRDPHICYLEDLQTAVLLLRPYGDNDRFKAGAISFR